MGDGDHERDTEEELAAPEQPEPEAAGQRALAQALKGSFFVLKMAMILLVIFCLFKGIFSVRPSEVVVKLRFGDIAPSWQGKWVLEPGSGAHVQFPWEELEVIPTAEQALPLTQDFWTEWRKKDPSQKLKTLDVRTDGYLITGDANIVHMQMRVLYRARGDAAGALSYKFAIEDPKEILKRMVRSAAVKVVGSMDVMQVIKRQHLLDQITTEVRARLADFESAAGVSLGLDVREVEVIEKEGMKNPTEPYPVRKAFLTAQEAGSRKQKSIEEGRSRRTVVVEGAEAKAREIEAAARGHSARLVGAAKADAESMAKLLAVYKESESEAAILRETFHQRTMQEVLRYVRSAYVLYTRPDGAGRVLRLEHAPRRLPSREEEGHTPPGQ